jgi:CheY-like chemotaxis protein
MTRAEQQLLAGCHPGRLTMCGCGCWSWKIRLGWPTGSPRALRCRFALDVVDDAAASPDSKTSIGYDVVVLDHDLRQVHGETGVPSLVRDDSFSPILTVAAAADVEDQVDELELGADDYLGKPFALAR